MTPTNPLGRRALVTGVAGQDGGYMAEQLLAEGRRVWGLIRPGGLARAAELPWLRGVELIEGDLADRASLARAFAAADPEEIYNLASFSQPSLAWSDPEASANVNALGPLRLLELVREAGPGRVRFVQASTSEIFGPSAPNPQDERTPLCPATPYGSAKAYAHQLVAHYRERFGLFAGAAILYNHESPRRGREFVTRKITRAAARIKLGLERQLVLGDLDARRDWGYAPDYVRAMRLMLGADAPDDYVIGTGETHSVGEFLQLAFARVGLRPEEFVRVDPSLGGHSNPVGLAADAARARDRLGWRPTVGFEQLVGLMVEADLAREGEIVPSPAGRGLG
ncbi:MAG TPA: GDP-mannose 4,6-dehydratase [Chloroflexota bacterium]|nr:GDP-mannose 4,6-dehydratase [Chloroflexota bacterium]